MYQTSFIKIEKTGNLVLRSLCLEQPNKRHSSGMVLFWDSRSHPPEPPQLTKVAAWTLSMIGMNVEHQYWLSSNFRYSLLSIRKRKSTFPIAHNHFKLVPAERRAFFLRWNAHKTSHRSKSKCQPVSHSRIVKLEFHGIFDFKSNNDNIIWIYLTFRRVQAGILLPRCCCCGS